MTDGHRSMQRIVSDYFYVGINFSRFSGLVPRGSLRFLKLLTVDFQAIKAHSPTTLLQS